MADQSDNFLQIDDDPEVIEFEVIEDGAEQDSVEAQSVSSDDEPIVIDDDVSADVEKFQKEVDHLREMYLRKLAEFDNFRKRTERENAERAKLAGLEVVQDLIPVIDNLHRALEHSAESSREALAEGVEMISKQLIDVLERRGLEIFDPTGEVFDPESHEAIQRVEDSDLPPGTIAWVLVKGFRFGGRLLRPAMVGVVAEKPGRGPAAETVGEAESGEGNGS
jgi:molecular chaperone GrpE